MALEWKNKKVIKAYVKSIKDGSKNEINITKKYYHDPFFYSLLSLKNNHTKILDVGCGNGYMLNYLKLQYPDNIFFGVDLQETLNNIQNSKNINYIAAQSNKLPFKDNFFDLVFSSLLFHWIEDAYCSTKEIYRVLKPGKKTIVSLINPNIFHVGKWVCQGGKVKYILEKDISKTQNIEVYINKTVGPIMYFMRPKKIYKKIFTDCGFKDIKLFEPTINEKNLLNIYPELNKYQKYPLYLFIAAKKL
jgi:ubiquinone/menaquinone biosynthesis C-methylase UbiE